MTEVRCQLPDEAATLALGRYLGQGFASGGIIFLHGALGAGKTTLTRGVLRALGHTGAVKSPTYTLVEPYEFGDQCVYHFDLYRLADAEELEYLGFRDYFFKQSLCLIEWPSRAQGFLPQPDLDVVLSVEGAGRLAALRAYNPAASERIEGLENPKC